MNKGTRVWWSTLADQYEEWAESGEALRRYTCDMLVDSEWFSDLGDYPGDALAAVWRDRYGDNAYPAGRRSSCEGGIHFPLDYYTDEGRVFDFCHYMAETIREAIGED